MPRMLPVVQTEQNKPPASPYQAFRERWQDGCGSGLCERARHIVHFRGVLPCDVAFVGEAPGMSEDVLGKPFVGPAGKLMDRIIRDSLPPDTRHALMNLVGCVPLAIDGKGKATEPTPNEILTCQPRIFELLQLARPRLVVCVGGLASKHTFPKKVGKTKLADREWFQTPSVSVVHPAAILRASVAVQGFTVHKNVVTIRDAWEAVCNGDTGYFTGGTAYDRPGHTGGADK